MKSNRFIKKLVYVAIAAALFGAGSLFSYIWDVPEDVVALSGGRSDSSATGGALLPSFAGIVKSRKEAVVNIATTRVIKDRRYGSPHGQFDPFRDFFGDDFFEKFFGERPRREYKAQNLGSGFIISKDGYILTNNHVVEKADEIIVRLSDEREFKAELVGKDPKTDVALIKIKDHDDLPLAVLGDSDSIEVGEWVIAIGNPFGVGQTVTAGIVSAKGRDIGAGPYDDFIQTDASINPGNSGGPLFNVKGEVVGINTAIFSPSGGNVGIGFAIPVNMAKRLIPQLKETGGVTRGWLGVMIQPITKELAESFDLPSEEGALVADVVEGSPAEKSGIKRGDVITFFDGEKIGKMRDLPAIVAATPVGRKVKVKVVRNGKTKVLKVKIEKLEGSGEEKEEESIIDELGMSVQEMTPELTKRLDFEGKEGVIISMIESGGIADRGGLRRGDVIMEINKDEIKDKGDYRKVMKKLKKGDTVLFLIWRDGNTSYKVLTFDK
ncbi:MAG: DegQ family serine endoprotease [Deltaproteobacteria bacterium]|nr:DegQ family serine endoprotease [Deltaproteobacteria bacterium]